MRKYLALTAMATLFAGCVQDDGLFLQEQDAPISISSAEINDLRMSRAGGTPLTSGELGLYITGDGLDEKYTIANCRFTYSESEESGPGWYPYALGKQPLFAGAGKQSAYAYYPYGCGFVNNESYTTNGATDLLWWKSETTLSEPTFPIDFDHALSKLTINLKKGNEVTSDIIGVTVEGTVLTATPHLFTQTWTIAQGTVSAPLSATEITTTSGMDATFSTLLIPQSTSALKITILTSSNQVFVYNHDIEHEFVQGTAYTLGLQMDENRTYMFPLKDITVNSWADGGSLSEDGVAGEGSLSENGIPYLTFTADAEQTMKVVVNDDYVLDESLQYSVGGGDWTQLTAGTAIAFGGQGNDLRLRGQSSTGMAESLQKYSQISFGNATPVSCTGDIRTLVDYTNYNNTSTAEARFCHFFVECTQLTSAPALPATTLAEFCYAFMFLGCSGLTESPELPATTLSDYCYSYMFMGCSSLTDTPVLPATTIAARCYYSMFYSCTSLTEAPALPATTLAESCYAFMFFECSALTEAPELPATTLAESCYQQMFDECTTLTEAPELPATTLKAFCYFYMFGGCTSLTEAPELPATTLAESCYGGMFQYCTNLIEAPELPATTLAESCYKGMFENCSSLTVAPALPAETLTDYCYMGMFKGCTSLDTAPALPAKTMTTRCYDSMFAGCINLTEATALPAETLAFGCYSYMFTGCSSLTDTPELPAKTLAEVCYEGMFNHCANLNSVTMLATDISAYNCLFLWLSGVSATGTFTKAAEMTSLPSGISGIPENWTVVNQQ